MAAKKTTRTRSAGKADDFYVRLRERVTGWTKSSSINPKYRDYVLALPDLFHLVVKLTMDRRVDPTSKAVLGAAIAWAIVPFDILPDVLGPLGMLDDLLVLVLALDFMLDRTPRSVVQEHWAGTGDVFELIRNVLDRADEWMGRGLYQKIRSMMTRGMAAVGGRKASPAATGTGSRGSTGRARKTGARRRKASSPGTTTAAAAATAAPRGKGARKTASRKTASRKTASRSAASRKTASRKSAARKAAKAGA